MGDIVTGKRVRLQGLKGAPELNGAEGTITGPLQNDRYPVKLHGDAAKLKPNGVYVKPSNLDPLGQVGVKISGWEMTPMQVPVELQHFEKQSSKGWHSCPIPALFGFPLALYQLNPHKHNASEQPATYLMADVETGFAPPWVQLNRLGDVLVARVDGQDYSVEDSWRVHDYMSHLMDLYSDWCSQAPNAAREQKQLALQPAAYARYTREARAMQAQQ